MSKTIIVTGGAGFIGSNFIFHMLKKYPDYRIICLDKLTYAGNLSTLQEALKQPNFRFVKADIADREAVYRLFEEEKPDVVVNGERHAKEVQGSKGEVMPSRYPGKYRIDLHIDDDVSVAQNVRTYGFKVFIIGEQDDMWVEKIIKEVERIRERTSIS